MAKRRTVKNYIIKLLSSLLAFIQGQKQEEKEKKAKEEIKIDLPVSEDDQIRSTDDAFGALDLNLLNRVMLPIGRSAQRRKLIDSNPIIDALTASSIARINYLSGGLLTAYARGHRHGVRVALLKIIQEVANIDNRLNLDLWLAVMKTAEENEANDVKGDV